MTQLNLNDVTVAAVNNVAAVETKAVETKKEEKEMKITMTFEELKVKTVKELRGVAKAVGVKGYSKLNKTDLVAAIQFFMDEERKEAEVVVAPVIEEPVVETVEEKEEKKVMKEKYMDAKWDKLVKALAYEYVKQSLNRKWTLFYKNTKSTTTKSEYLVKSSKLWGCTAKVIKTLYGEANCNENTIHQTLNVMVVRGYLNFKRVYGRNGSVNVVFNATKDQMNAMYKLSK